MVQNTNAVLRCPLTHNLTPAANTHSTHDTHVKCVSGQCSTILVFYIIFTYSLTMTLLGSKHVEVINEYPSV
jgi:hypothetical protein